MDDSIKKELQTIRESQIRMEADINYHIKRTDIIEERTEKLWKSYIGIQWTLALGAGILTLLLNLERLKGFFS